jgi:hypothetical protein
MTKSTGQRRRWADEEVEFVKANPGMRITEICKALSRSKGSVNKLRAKLGISSDFHTPWSEDDVETLTANSHLQNKELAVLMGRTPSAISGKRMYSGLRMERTCLMCHSTFTSLESNTRQCPSCNPEGVRNKRSPMVRLMNYRDGARIRELPFELTPAEFYSFWQKPCTYCGTAIETIGLDRIEPDSGYSLHNVVPCCSRCNEMKMADTTKDWILKMKQILNNMGETL